MIRHFKQNIVTVVFLLVLAVVCLSTLIFGVKTYGATLLSHNSKLPENANIFDHFSVFKTNFESATNTAVAFKDEFINVFGVTQKMLNMKRVEDPNSNNTVYIMRNGQLVFLTPEDESIEEKAQNILELRRKLSNNNTPFMYVNAPCKINKYDDERFFDGAIDYANQNADNLLNILNSNATETMDLRENVYNSELNYDDLFFATDHHWKTQSAFWAYSEIAKKISDDFNLKIDEDYLDINNFNQYFYKNKLLGSQGSRVGSSFAGRDDYTLITPKFETNYKVSILRSNGNVVLREGDFEKSILAIGVPKNGFFEKIHYARYLSADEPKVEIENSLKSDGNILIVQDSFGSPVSAFLSLHYNHTTVLDLRAYKFESLFEYLDENKFDLVIMLYNTGVQSKNLFEFK